LSSFNLFKREKQDLFFQSLRTLTRFDI